MPVRVGPEGSHEPERGREDPAQSRPKSLQQQGKVANSGLAPARHGPAASGWDTRGGAVTWWFSPTFATYADQHNS